jgi:hypothetical protein
MGSLSYRANIGPMMKNSVVDDVTEKENETAEETTDNTELVALKKKKLRRCEESKNKIEKEYVECERELQSKTAEV